MTWDIKGDGKKLNIDTTKSGNLRLKGEAQLTDLDWQYTDEESALAQQFIQRCKKAKISWSIINYKDAINLDWNDDWEKWPYEEDLHSNLAVMVHFYATEERDRISVEVAAPKKIFENLKELFSQVLNNLDLEYFFFIDFSGFSNEYRKYPNKPYLLNFLGEHKSNTHEPFFSDEVNILIKRKALEDII